MIDLCAAPGGKTTYIGELLKNIGEIVAVDKYETRLNVVRSACQRLGIANVQFLTADAQNVNLPPADKVLVDVPCSGLGVLAKKPDSKWKREKEDLIRLADTQQRILNHAASLVKSGGILVYSTCTNEPEENVEIIRAFLEGHPDFTIENAADFVHADLVQADGFVSTFAHVHGMDGSFAVRMRKKSSD